MSDHGGTKESNLTIQTEMDISDFVRIYTSGSRRITLQNLLDSSSDYLQTLGFITDVVNVRLRKITNIITNYGLLITDDIVLADATSAELSINLMLASAAFSTPDGYVFTIKKINATTNKVILNPTGGELIDGAANLELIGTDLPYIHIVSDGTAWWTI